MSYRIGCSVVEKRNGLCYNLGVRYIDEIILHHTALNTERHQFQEIYAMHIKRWGRGAYHWFIERDGTVIAGVPEEKIGYHAGEHNPQSIGICLAGDLRYQKPTDSQIVSMCQVVRDVQARYGIPDQRIFLHKEVRPTSCPVINLRSYILYAQPEYSPEAQEKRIMKAITRATARGLLSVRDSLVRTLERMRSRL
jgi:N-acetylmuramoyl-L-alanine amidase